MRVVAVLAFVALAATGWDAEAGWRRHHRQASCCEPVCCEPVCCERVVYEPACETVCDPCRTSARASVCVTRTVEPSCCYRSDWGYTVVEERVIVPAVTCCESRIVAAEQPAEAARGVVTAADRTSSPKPQPTVARSVLTSSAR